MVVFLNPKALQEIDKDFFEESSDSTGKSEVKLK